MQDQVKQLISGQVKQLYGINVDIELERPEEQFGDFSTNVSLKLAAQLKRPPKDIADELVVALNKSKTLFAKIEAAKQGFINFTLGTKALNELCLSQPAKSLEGKVVVAEYSDANPFKVLHAGHVYTTVVGDAIANLLENAGASTHRVNYGGDVGRHVAITMWAILEELGGEHPEKLADIASSQHADWMSKCYTKGNTAFEDDETVRTKVTELNKRIYQLHTGNDHTSPFAQIYWTCRKWSYENFDAFFARFGTKLEKYYPESEVSDLGLETVKAHIGKVFEESDGAVIFNGEKYDLHTRVFINSQGLPTYEAKEVGLIAKKNDDYHFDRSIVITDNEQEKYMEVVLLAIEQFWPELVHRTTHITHGKVKLVGNTKMSSRKGNIVKADEVLDVTSQELKQAGRATNDSVMLGSVKYAFIKTRIGGDIIYDPRESIALEGNSGPYLQYAYARASNILAKAGSPVTKELDAETDYTAEERSLVRKIGQYAETVEQATDELKPHYLATYLYELAQVFNRFYERSRVVGDEREALRISLVKLYRDKLAVGLALLGIDVLEKM